MNDTYTPKQRELLRLWQNDKLKRINLLEGSVSSGKTWISLVLWAFWVATSPKDKNYLMVGKTLTSLKRNCLDLLESLVGSAYFTYSISQKQGELFGRRVYFEGVNDIRAENKIRGITLMGAYCDEVTLFTEDFFAMLLSRLRENGAKMIASTNPDRPNHWLMKNYIKRADELGMLVIKFLIDDNTFLARDYVESIKKEYTGVFYDRFILGRWVTAQGAIYQLLADNTEKYMIDRCDVPDLHSVNVGEDFGGNKSGHAIVCSAIGSDGRLYFTKAKYHEAKGTTADDLIAWSLRVYDEMYADTGQYFGVYADNAEQILINSIRAKTNFSMYNSFKRPIIDRIRFLNILLATDRVRFVRGETEVLVDALSNACWDDKKMEDVRLDDGSYNNDIIDAAEYSFEYNMDWMVN